MAIVFSSFVNWFHLWYFPGSTFNGLPLSWGDFELPVLSKLPYGIPLRNLVRKKRHAQTLNVLGRINELYSAVVHGEECMEKIACDIVADIGLNPDLTAKLTRPHGLNCQQIKCGPFV